MSFMLGTYYRWWYLTFGLLSKIKIPFPVGDNISQPEGLFLLHQLWQKLIPSIFKGNNIFTIQNRIHTFIQVAICHTDNDDNSNEPQWQSFTLAHDIRSARGHDDDDEDEEERRWWYIYLLM